MTRAQLGSIQRLDKGRYRVSLEGDPKPDGKRTRVTKVVRGSRDDAEIELAKMKLDAGKRVNEDMKVSMFWKTIYLPRIEGRLAPTTIRGYKQAWEANVERLFGAEYMSDLTPRKIENELWKIDAPGSQENAYKLMRQMFNMAFDWEMIESNPMARRISLKRKPHYEPEVYTLQELKKWVALIRGADMEAALLCCAFGGLRREEALALRWSDIVFSEVTSLDGKRETRAVLRIDKAIVEVRGDVFLKPTKTPKSTRTVVISEPTASRLRELGEGISGPLCPGKHDGYDKPGNVAKRYSRVFKGHDLKYIPMKNLRTTYATIQQQLGTDSAIISAALGHSTFSTAYRHYFATNEQSFIEASDRIGKAL